MKLEELFNNLKTAGEQLETLEATGEAAAGDVRATVNGKHTLVKLEIADHLLNPKDKVMLQDLVVAAVNLAQRNIEEQLKATLQDKMSGLL